MTESNFRALCARMADELDHYRQLLMDDRRATHALAAEARAALAAEPEADGEVAELVVWLRYNADYALQKAATATFKRFHRAADLLERLPQPEPVAPTDEEWDALWDEEAEYFALYAEARRFGRAILARWGRPAIEPVPVSERLPGLEDCDAEGRCWLHQPHPATPETPVWRLMPARYASTIYGTTHWLPYWALPVPRS